MSTAESEGRANAVNETADPRAEQVLPLMAEHLSVSRRKVETGGVRVTVSTRTQEQIIEEHLRHDRVEVERVAIGREIDAVPPVREEDGTVIIPVVEEVLVVVRRLILKEEVRLRRVTVREAHVEKVVTRSQDAIVTRFQQYPARPVDGQMTDHPDIQSHQKDPDNE